MHPGLELQALLSQMFAELGADPSVRCIVLTGGDKGVRGGGDIHSMAGVGPIEIHQRHPGGCGRRSSTAPSR